MTNQREKGSTKPLALVTVCNVGYQEYIPWYLLFATTAYPDYTSLVYVDGFLQPHVSGAMAYIDGDYRILTNAFDGYDTSNDFVIKSLRWVHYAKEFDEYDNLYYGDLDLLICRDDPPLLDAHLSHCELLGLPYSNQVRDGRNNRLTGLHFVRCTPWFEKMRPIMEAEAERLRSGESIPEHIRGGLNEELLYDMVRRSGVGLPKTMVEDSRPEYRYRPHHGFHLGVWRAKSRQRPRKLLRSAHGPLVTGPEFQHYWQQFQEIRSTTAFQRLLQLLEKPRHLIQHAIRFYEHMGY